MLIFIDFKCIIYLHEFKYNRGNRKHSQKIFMEVEYFMNKIFKVLFINFIVCMVFSFQGCTEIQK